MPKARRKSPRTSKRTKTNAADERAGAVIESLTSDVDAKEKMQRKKRNAKEGRCKGRKDFSPVILLFYERLVNIDNHGPPDSKPCHVLAATFIQSLIMIYFLLVTMGVILLLNWKSAWKTK